MQQQQGRRQHQIELDLQPVLAVAEQMQAMERPFDEQEQQLDLPAISVDGDDLPGGQVPAVAEQDELTAADDKTDDTPGATILAVFPLVTMHLEVLDSEQPGNSTGQLDWQDGKDFLGD